MWRPRLGSGITYVVELRMSSMPAQGFRKFSCKHQGGAEEYKESRLRMPLPCAWVGDKRKNKHCSSHEGSSQNDKLFSP